MQDNPITIKIEFLDQLDSVHQQSFLIRREDGQYLRVAKSTYIILQLMDGTRTFSEIATICQEKWNINLDEGQLKKIIEEKFIPNRLIQNSFIEPRNWLQKKFTSSLERFILVKLTLFSAPRVQRIADIMRGLFNPKTMLALSSLSLVAHILFYMEHPPGQMFDESSIYNYWFIPIVWLVIAALHELGHAAACYYYGVQPGAIGIGLYIVFPVLWTDLTAAWQLKRFQRVVVDLGGLYMEWIINIVLIILSFTFNFSWISFLIFWNNLSILYNLIPFLRLDGYWLFSDLVGIPNLDRESRNALQNLVSRRKPDIDRHLHGISRVVFYLYVITSILITPFVLYRVWFFMAWIIRDLPQKTMELQTIFGDMSHTSLLNMVTVATQVLIMLAMLIAWAISFIVPIIQQTINFIGRQQKNLRRA